MRAKISLFGKGAQKTMLICVILAENPYLCDMKEYRLTDWLPTTKKEVDLRGWDELDVILFSGDAYVDHPSFGAAVIGRILEAEGLRVAIVPPSPFVFRHLRGVHGLYGQPLHGQQTTAQR